MKMRRSRFAGTPENEAALVTTVPMGDGPIRSAPVLGNPAVAWARADNRGDDLPA
jgi:hypothetical protein